MNIVGDLYCQKNIKQIRFLRQTEKMVSADESTCGWVCAKKKEAFAKRLFESGCTTACLILPARSSGQRPQQEAKARLAL